MPDEDFSICPFNKSHRIIQYRMPAHIIKCRRNYCGPPLEQCIYNATHFVPVGTMTEHLQSCKDCFHFNQSKYVGIAKSIKRDI